MTPSVFIDTSALYAIYSARDRDHAAAAGHLKALRAEGVDLVTTSLVILESYILVFSRHGRRDLLRFRRGTSSSPWLRTIPVTAGAESAAWARLERDDDKEYSFVDTTSFVVMGDMKLARAFAFDDDFEQAGFVVEPPRLRSR